MLDFLSFLWPWLAACLAIGAATGALARDAAPQKRPARWLMWFGAAFFAAALALSFGAVEGVVSAALESALACFAAFVTGAAVVAAFRGTLAANERWALGLLPAALLWVAAVQIGGAAYEAHVLARVAALAKDAGVDPAGVSVAGRDVTLPPAMSDNRELVAHVVAAPGVRRVTVAQAAPPAQIEKAPEPTQPPPAPSGGDLPRRRRRQRRKSRAPVNARSTPSSLLILSPSPAPARPSTAGRRWRSTRRRRRSAAVRNRRRSRCAAMPARALRMKRWR